MKTSFVLLGAMLALPWPLCAETPLVELPFAAQPLEPVADRSSQMVEGIRRWLEEATAKAATERAAVWKAAAAGPNWEEFAHGKRALLREMLGVVDLRVSAPLEEYRALVPPPARAAATGDAFSTTQVRWPVFDSVYGEGALFRPNDAPRGTAIVIPDADQAPESCARARRLAAEGWLVLAPVLVDRRDSWSGSNAAGRFTNQPHREWIQRQAFELGRTITGLEVQKMLAAADALALSSASLGITGDRVELSGEGEGGLLALICGALEERFAGVSVGGYFGPREGLYAEPLYRNVFGLLREFGDAELAALTAPRPLTIEDHPGLLIAGPPPILGARKGAAPGTIAPPTLAAVEAEVARANGLRSALRAPPLRRVRAGDELAATTAGPLTGAAVDARQQRTVRELENFCQKLVVAEEQTRSSTCGEKVQSGADWAEVQRKLRDRFWRGVIGKIETTAQPPGVRARPLLEHEKWRAYEVTLDVLPGVFAWGWLLLPRDLAAGERRPVVVCQHGLEGLPEDVVSEDPQHPAFHYYQGFAARLAEEGYIVFAPHNPYRGGDRFRELQRRANPLGLSLFSFIIAQHEVLTQWLADLPFVDPQRIGFYGLSYGGKSAMRLPALIERYALSICSGDFNEWVRKNVSPEYRGSYLFTGEYEMPEWNLAGVAGYAELAMLIAPRPFMVERGHRDGVGMDEWVGYEYAKVRRGYDLLGLGDRTAIEWFDGPHTIHGAATFEFLRQHLGPAHPR